MTLAETKANPDLDRRVRELERRLDHLEGDSDPDAVAAAARLGELEEELLALLPAVARIEPGPVANGNPVLADGAKWRDLAQEAGAPASAARAETFVQDLVDGEARHWRETARIGADPQGRFEALSDARLLDLEALSYRDRNPPLAEARPELRQAFVDAVAAEPPSPEVRRTWARELLDRADAVLTAGDEDDDARPARLALVAGDLEWHARNVDKRPRLLRKVRRIRAEIQEQLLQSRLERRFGVAAVARFDRMIMALIVFVLGLLAIELVFDVPERLLWWMHVADTACCVVFLWEFFVRLRFVRGRGYWFARHFFVDFLPSLPFAYLLRWVRGLRIVRLARIARLVRGFGFLTRGSDRIVRRYGHLLNRNVVRFPTRGEYLRARATADGIGHRARHVQARLSERWQELLVTAPAAAREAIAAERLDGLERSRAAGHLYTAVSHGPRPPPDEVLADELLDRLATLGPQELEAEMGHDFVLRVARAVRVFSYPPIRWFPVIRKYVPRLRRDMTPAEVVVAAAQRSAHELRRHHSRWFWFADLYGTVTPSQFVDRVGSAMVKSSFRPAYRLLLFGLLYYLFVGIFRLSDLPVFDAIAGALSRILGPVLQVLGTICFVILGVGWWLRRLAGQATDFFAQSARAQYLALTESFKSRHVERDAAILDRHVFAPERLLDGAGDGTNARARFVREVRRWMLEAQPGPESERGFDAVARAVLLYRDGLDGSLLVDSDTRTTAQLLGNPALRNLRLMSARFRRSDDKEITRLDLERQRSLFRGPYLWFGLVCQAVADGTARLIVDYNRHALPLAQFERATREERERYERWLASEETPELVTDQARYVTIAFTALEFLDADPARDEGVAGRFGPAVLRRLRRDRRHLVRRIFGAYPLHKRPRDERVVNLYRFYHRWFAGGSALLIPFRLFARAFRIAGRGFHWLRRCIGEIRRPRFEVDHEAVEGAEFRTALRKIQRMRGPVAEAAIRLRARFDAEYLGVRLPGTEQSGLEEQDAAHDLEFLDADPELAVEIDRARRRCARDVARFGRLLRDGLQERLVQRLGLREFTREHLRAATAAYVADLDEVRRHLSARAIPAEAFERWSRREPLPRALWPRPRLHGIFKRYWKEHGTGNRRCAWRALRRNADGSEGALLAWDRHGDGAAAEGERILADLIRHPDRISDQIVTLRAVQTMSLIDVLNYREHIYRLGDYEASGDDCGTALTLT